MPPPPVRATSDFVLSASNRNPHIGRERLDSTRFRALFLAFCVCLAFGGIAAQLTWVGLFPPQEEPRTNTQPLKENPRRGDITDRNGQLLATTLAVQSLFADPREVLDIAEIAKKLPPIIPELKADVIRARLSNPKRQFVWLARHLTPKEVNAIHRLGLPGLGFRDELVRVYPQMNLFAHVLGGVDVDSNGISGIELTSNKTLAKGENIKLTIDMRLQQQLRKTLREITAVSDAKAAWGVVMDPKTGDILAMVSTPDFDPHHLSNYQQESLMNKASLGVYEMGSIFKIFTLAEALEAKSITPDTPIDCRKDLKIGRFTISDYKGKYRVLSAREVLQYSSNIGAAQLADALGADHQREFLTRLKFFDPLQNVGLPEVGKSTPPDRWGRVQTMTISYGHGIAVTPLHMLAAASAIMSDGYYRPPTLLYGTKRPLPEKVLTDETVATMKDLLRTVVHEGTATRAQVQGLDVGGKTGTAEKNKGGRYSENKNLASFVGAVPLDNPRLVALIMVDEGRKDYATGGQIAAPAFGSFVRRVAPIMGMKRDIDPVMLSPDDKPKDEKDWLRDALNVARHSDSD